VAAVGGGGSVDSEEWQLTGEVFWQAPGAKVSHFRSLWLELCCICRILAILAWICMHRLCIASASTLSIVLQTKACKEEVQTNPYKEEEGASKVCNCLPVLRELAAENMVLRQEVEDKKVLVTSLKKQCILQNAELRSRDRKELCWLVLAIYACIVAMCAMFVRF
jgi:hypothetical protein